MDFPKLSDSMHVPAMIRAVSPPEMVKTASHNFLLYALKFLLPGLLG